MDDIWPDMSAAWGDRPDEALWLSAFIRLSALAGHKEGGPEGALRLLPKVSGVLIGKILQQNRGEQPEGSGELLSILLELARRESPTRGPSSRLLALAGQRFPGRGMTRDMSKAWAHIPSISLWPYTFLLLTTLTRQEVASQLLRDAAVGWNVEIARHSFGADAAASSMVELMAPLDGYGELAWQHVIILLKELARRESVIGGVASELFEAAKKARTSAYHDHTASPGMARKLRRQVSGTNDERVGEFVWRWINRIGRLNFLGALAAVVILGLKAMSSGAPVGSNTAEIDRILQSLPTVLIIDSIALSLVFYLAAYKIAPLTTIATTIVGVAGSLFWYAYQTYPAVGTYLVSVLPFDPATISFEVWERLRATGSDMEASVRGIDHATVMSLVASLTITALVFATVLHLHRAKSKSAEGSGYGSNSSLAADGGRSPNRSASNKRFLSLGILLIPISAIGIYWWLVGLVEQQGLKVWLWVTFTLCVYIAVTVHIVVMGLLARFWLGLPIKEMSLGTGRRLLSVTIGDVPICVKLLVIGGSINFADHVSSSPALKGRRRAVIELSGCLALLALAASILGGRPLSGVLTFWHDLLGASISPFDRAQDLLAQAGDHLRATDSWSLLGVICSRVAAINLLPIPILNGGNAIVECFGSNSKWLTDRRREIILRIGLLGILLLMGSWCLALGYMAYVSWVKPALASAAVLGAAL